MVCRLKQIEISSGSNCFAGRCLNSPFDEITLLVVNKEGNDFLIGE